MSQQREAKEDCFACRAVGVVTTSGLAAYFAHVGLSTPRANRSQRVFTGLLALGAAGAAVYRAIY